MRFLLIYLLLLPNVLVGQEPGFWNFNSVYGFSETTVYDLQEDAEGNIWFGTSNGLYRFDGSEFKHFFDSRYSIEYSVLTLAPDSKLWFQNFSGQLFYFERDSVRLFADVAYRLGNTMDYTLANYPEVVFGTTKGLFRKSVGSDSLELWHNLHTCSMRNTNLPNQISVICKWEDEQVYATVSDTGICTRPPELFPPKSYDLTLALGGKNPIVLDRLAGTSKLWELRNDSVALITSCSTITYNGLSRTSDGTLYLRTKQGYRQLPDTSSQYFLANEQIAEIMLDRNGNLWVATTSGGVFIASNTAVRRYKISETPLFSSVQADDSTMYMLDNNGKLYRWHNAEKALQPAAQLLNYGEHIVYDKQQGIVYPREHKLGWSHRLQQLDTVHLHTLKNLLVLNNGDRIQTSPGGSSYLPSAHKTEIDFPLSEASKQRLLSNASYFYLRTQRCNQIVAAPDQKAIYIDYVDGLFAHTSTSTDPMQWDGNNILVEALCNGEGNQIWVSDKQHNILRILHGEVEKMATSPLSVQRLVQHDSLLFLQHERSITRFNLVTGAQSSIDVLDGLLEEAIVACYVVGELLYVFSTNHLHTIPLGYNPSNTTAPVVWIRSVGLFNQPATKERLADLDFDENNISVHFGARSIASQLQYKFEYRLLGISEEWNSIPSDQPFVSFPKLAPGNYVFELRAVNEDEVCSSVVSMPINIALPFYQQLWFYFLLVVATGALLSIIFATRARIQRGRQQLLREAEQLKHQLAQSQMTALRAQMNPHFLFNALNTIQEYILTNQKDIASEYLADFADLMRKFLEQSKQESITLQEEVETISLYLKLEQLRFADSLHFELNVDQRIDAESERIPVMLLQPFIENAIKHGLLHKEGSKQLSIAIDRHENGYSVTIEDNGVGRKKSAEINQQRKRHTSFATSAIANRIELLNNRSSGFKIAYCIQDLTTEQHHAAGTKVTIEICHSPSTPN